MLHIYQRNISVYIVVEIVLVSSRFLAVLDHYQSQTFFWFCNQQDSLTNMIADRLAWSLMC